MLSSLVISFGGSQSEPESEPAESIEVFEGLDFLLDPYDALVLRFLEVSILLFEDSNTFVFK